MNSDGTKSIEELTSEIKRLKRLVYFDELTGILNRRGFKEEAEKIFKALVYKGRENERRTGNDSLFSIVFIDIDDFKGINDAYGHEKGDEILKRVAEILDKRLRTTDVLARWGGEEFVVALFGAGKDVGKRVAEDVKKNINDSEFNLNGKVSASIGVAGYSGENSLNELIDKADKAMYLAKTTGKDKIVVAD